MKVSDTENRRKHVKAIISERMPDVQVIKSTRKNESDKFVLPYAVSQAVELRSERTDHSKMVENIKNTAYILRDEILNNRDWSFTGNFEDYKIPNLLTFFISQLLLGRQSLKLSPDHKRNSVPDNSINVACQYLIQNTKTNRQVKYTPKRELKYRQTVQTHLSIGLPSSLHARVRDKVLLQNISLLYIGNYHNIINLEKTYRTRRTQKNEVIWRVLFAEFH